MFLLGSPAAMHPEPAPTICILRRMKRKPLSMWAWSAYNPSKALPQELRFDLLDKDVRNIGTLAYTKVNFFKGSELSTPWGPAKLAFETWKGGLKISLNERELVKLDSHLFSKRMKLIFSTGAMMVFVPRKGFKNDLEFYGDNGYVGIFEEKGVLQEGFLGSQPQLTKDEIKVLPKDQRPKSIETREYRQFRLKASGELPVRLEEATAAMMIFASFGCLVEEIPS